MGSAVETDCKGTSRGAFLLCRRLYQMNRKTPARMTTNMIEIEMPAAAPPESPELFDLVSRSEIGTNPVLLVEPVVVIPADVESEVVAEELVVAVEELVVDVTTPESLVEVEVAVVLVVDVVPEEVDEVEVELVDEVAEELLVVGTILSSTISKFDYRNKRILSK